MRGHEEASGTKYVPQELMDMWAIKDPIKNFKEFLLKTNVLNEEIDIAVHSLKDLQTDLPKGLKLACITKRHPVEDVLIAKNKKMTIDKLPVNATVATGSLRRRAQLKPQRLHIQN